MTIEQMADSSGFGSVSSIYRAFKNAEETSFSNWRKQIKSNP